MVNSTNDNSIEKELYQRDKVRNTEQRELDAMSVEDYMEIYEGKKHIWIRDGRRFIWKKTVKEVPFKGKMESEEFVI